jgi:hypothetical protein
VWPRWLAQVHQTSPRQTNTEVRKKMYFCDSVSHSLTGLSGIIGKLLLSSSMLHALIKLLLKNRLIIIFSWTFYTFLTLFYITLHWFLCVCYSYAADEIHFNLMAIVSDRKKLYEKQIAEADQRRELAAKKV